MSWSATSCGVSVLPASMQGANADTISDRGATTSLFLLPSFHAVRMDIESLPTGMLMPICGHNCIATASTVSNSAASSPRYPAAAIQLADNFTSPMLAIRAAARLVSASPTAMRPEAGPSITAIGVRSPIAKASPRSVAKPINDTATSATGTCQGPTKGSREHNPPTVRSPIEIRNVLLATAGKRSTRSTASFRSIPELSSAGSRCSCRCTSRIIFGGLPSTTSSDISTG